MALLALGIPFLGSGQDTFLFMVFVYAFLPFLKEYIHRHLQHLPVYGDSPGHRPDPDAANQPSGAAHDHALIMLGIRIAAVSSVGTSNFTKRNILGEIYTELIDINTNPQSRPALQPGRGRHHVLSGFGAGPH